MLRIQDLHVHYDKSQALFGVSLDVGKAEIVAMLGRNGAGKTTIIKTLVGLIKSTKGIVEVDGEDVTGLTPEEIAARGVAYVPDDKRLFPQLTALENLRLSAIGAKVMFDPESDDSILNYFPALKALLGRKAGTLSGGEQQMLTIARALLRRSPLVLLDEPSQGLAPSVLENLARAIMDLKNEFGISFLIVEQEMEFATGLAGRIYGLLTGSIVYEGTPNDFYETEAYRDFLGIA